ncbi:unnamed protein product [Cylindrotheca closterium]|uniref:Translin n=1 Tax=Cylindrotheca closterium TaxID=2856 RepID=A0AAD2FN20_9STRA|nr:unnamed protein product [Cylindrotheca closterium]
MTEDSTTSSKIPSAPFAYLSKDTELFLDLSGLEQVLSESNDQRQQAYDLGNQIKAALLKCRASLEQHQTANKKKELQDSLQALVQQALNFSSASASASDSDKDTTTSSGSVVRMGNLNNSLADYLRHQAYEHFIETGTLLSPPPPNTEYTDEEYLGGILSFVNFDLKRYVIGRGTHRDAHSVLIARDMVATLLDHLLQYDFRNGPLRRKYDGVKYTLKTCETVLYELSVTGCQEAMEAQQQQQQQEGGGASTEPPPSKRSKSEKSSSAPALKPSPFMNVEALEALRLRMVEKDELREKLIKKCRDGQKAAKQAIYALHRDDFDGAAQLLQQCEQCILEELEPIVKLEPNLRHGSYSNVLEEYAEAKLYQVWLVGKDNGGDGEDTSMIQTTVPAKVVLVPDDFSKIRLEPQEYLGGLCDLTGEIGRFAVKKATIRDKDNVKNCLETNMSVLYAMESMGRIPGNIGKKVDPLRRTVEKQERMLYELSLVEATGRNTIVAGVEANAEE